MALCFRPTLALTAMNFAQLPLHASDGPPAIRVMAQSDLPVALSLSEDVRWPHRPSDWKRLFQMGEGRVAEVGGAVVGVGMRWLWDERDASVGLLIVAPAFRERGIGSMLLEALCAGLEDRTVLLHAPGKLHRFYARRGFERIGEVHQYEGKALPAPLMALPEGCRLRPGGRNDLQLLVGMEEGARGVARPSLIQAWLRQSIGTVVLDHPDGPRGFAIIRRFGRGAMVGPVVAPCAMSAKAMIAHLAGLVTGRVLRLDVHADGEFEDWLGCLGLAHVADATVLARGSPASPTAPFLHFALADKALG
ncbi:GNAT family N-acetyltransferase [Cupriavidus sp. 8B]